MAIATVMPTKGRPDRAKEAFDSHDRTAVLDDTWMLPVFNIADSEYEKNVEWAERYSAGWIGMRGNMVALSNAGVRHILDNKNYGMRTADFVGWSADDQIFRTEGWDKRVAAEFENPDVAFVVTNDLHYGAEKPINIYTRREVVDALGWLLMPTLEHLYVDNVWHDLGEMTGTLVFLEDVIVEHMHPVYGKGPNDEQYQTLHQAEQYERDRAAYHEWQDQRSDSDARKVLECLESLR